MMTNTTNIKEVRLNEKARKQARQIFCSRASSKQPKIPSNPMETNQPVRLGRDFHLLNVAQFLGAFNDNVFKLFLIYALIAIKGEEAMGSINHLAGAIFVLPFLLFASSAGIFAGKFRKQSIIKNIKLVELGIMAAGGVAFYFQSEWGLYTVLFLMAAQSAFFGPAKLGIIPELLPSQALSKANGWQQAFVYMAIVLGTGLVPIFSRLTDGKFHWASLFCIAIAFVGWLLACGIKPTAPSGTSQSWNFNPLSGVSKTFWSIRKDRPLLLALLGAAFFLLIGGFVQMNLIPYGIEYTNIEKNEDASYLFLFVAVGIGIGALTAGKASGKNIEFGLVPFGAIGLLISLTLLGFKFGVGSILILGSILFVLGLSAGFFIVPLVAFIQWHSPRKQLTEILALDSFLSFCGVLIAAFILMALDALNLAPADCFLVAAGLTGVLTLLALKSLPDFLIRFIGAVLLRIVYRVRTEGLHHLPTKGSALIVCNHITYMDAPLLMSIYQRRIRFLVYRDYYEHKWLGPLLKLMGAIPISENDPPRQIMKSIQTARKALDDGYLVGIFAEGRLTRSGLISAFKPGYQKIIKGTNAPIIPVYLGGAWGSIFSHAGRGRYRNHRLRIPYPMHIHIGSPLPSSAEPHEVRLAVQELGSAYHEKAQSQKGSLATGMIKSARRFWGHPFVSDTTGKRLTQGKSLIGSLLLRDRLRKELSTEDEAVGVLLPSCVGGALVNFALALDARIAVNLNFTASPMAFESAIKQSGIKVTVTSKAFLDKIDIQNLTDRVIYLEDLGKDFSGLDKIKTAIKARLYPMSWLLPTKCFDRTRTASILFSSGSTAEPKGIKLSHHNLMSNVEAAVEVIPLDNHDGVSAALPFFHSFGVTGTIWLPALAGIKVHYHTNPLEGARIAEMVREEKSTILFATPTFLMGYIRKAKPEDFKSLKLIITGAEKLKTKLADMFEKKFNVRPLEGYGTTELSPIVSLNLPQPPSAEETSPTHKNGTVGHPIPGVSAKIVDPESRVTLPPKQEGMLFIKGPNVMTGYIGPKEKTDKVLQDGWYETGDIAKLDEDGFITITGRLSRFSKIGGEMVPHEAIEQVLIEEGAEHAEPVLAVTSIPCERKGEKLVVLYAEALGDKGSLLERLNQADIPNLWKPHHQSFYKIPKLPVLGTGKLDLKGIRTAAEELANGN
jgi:acyl-[acyl-carrier-protein]-phospholipid O-acyltransferase/long-chain-fatty-acid--[acyl-carrier-protein] ligase